MKKISDFFSTLPMSLVGGFFLLLSFFSYDEWGWVTMFICGLPMLYECVERFITNKGIHRISSEFLICIAMTGAIMINDLFAAGEVAFIMAIGTILENKTTQRANHSLKNLIELTPTMGNKLVDGKEVRIPVEEIQKGDLLRVKPGETVPVDGIVIKGTSSINQASLTGESLPVDKEINDEVYGGTINCFGSIDIKATNTSENSSIQKLVEIVKEAEKKKAPMQRIADTFASYFVPVSITTAIVTFLVTHELVRSVAVLVVFCPCALVLATPTAIIAAIGQASKHGIIVKSGEALEKMGKVNTITFDKTGTLTQGHLQVSDVVVLNKNYQEETFLSLVGALEMKSEHPLGKAIVEHVKKQNIEIKEAQEFISASGKGVYGKVDNLELYCGNEKYLSEHGVPISNEVKGLLKTYQNQGKASILASIDGECAGIIAMSDELKNDSKDIIAKLHDMDIDVVLLTGDNKQAASYFANQAGIVNVKADLLPTEKVENIESLQSEGRNVCMIGDGVNDAPALKTANVGVAMGAMGSAVAVDAADIALMQDDIKMIPYLKRLSNATVNTIKLSITLAMTINFIALILSVMGLLSPTAGALVHNIGSVFVVMIAAMLYDRHFD